MGYFGETKHKKVLRKSKKQWITVGLTSAALGMAGLVQTGELVSAEEVQTNAEVEEPEAEAEQAEKETSSVEELVVAYIEQFAQEDSDAEVLRAAFEAELAQLGETVDAEAARLELEAGLEDLEDVETEETLEEETEEESAETEEVVLEEGDEEESETELEEETEEVKEEAAQEPKEEELQVAQTAKLHSEQKEEPQVQAQARSVQPQIATFSATSQPQQSQVTDANLDANLGGRVHADGRTMEERQVEIRLNQTDVKQRAEQQIRDIRRDAYNRNLPFNNGTLKEAASSAGFNSAEEYANGFEWSDRLEDYAIQRSTELLTSGYHGGNHSHNRPSRTGQEFKYTSADGKVSQNIFESIHASGYANIDDAFDSWSREQEVNNLIKSNGALTTGSQAVTNAHLYQILNPVHTLMGVASVTMNDGSRGTFDRYGVYRSNVLISANGKISERARDLSGNSPNHSRDGVYRVTVLTPQGSPKLPGEVDPNANVELPVDFQTQTRFNINADEGSKRVVTSGKKGVSVNGRITVQPVDEVVEYGPVRETLEQGPDQEVFDASLPVDAVNRVEGKAGYQLINPLTDDVVKTVAPKATVITYGPVAQEQDFETERRVNFELDLGESNVVVDGQNGVVHVNPLTDDVVEVVNEVVNQVVEVGVKQREVPFETERRAVVGLDEERVVREGTTGVAYFDENGEAIESDRDMAPVSEIVEYPAEAREVAFETERVAVVGLEEEHVAVEGEAGIAFYDEDGNVLDAEESVEPVTQVVHYPAEAREVEFNVERRPVVGLEEERVAVQGEVGLAFYDEDGNVLDAEESVEPVTQIVEYPAEAREVPFETERIAIVGLEEERIAVEGETGLAFYDEEGNLLDVEESVEPVTQVVEYPAEEREVPFETERVENKELAAGKERLVQEGKPGVAYFDEDGEKLEAPENVDPVNEIIEFGSKSDKPSQPSKGSESGKSGQAGKGQDGQKQETGSQQGQSSVANDAKDVIKGLSHLSDDEKAMILSAIDSTNDADKLEDLVEAAYELHLSRQAVEGKQDSEAKEEVVQAGVTGKRLPDTATSTWALGLIGVTTLLSGLGVKKFKN